MIDRVTEIPISLLLQDKTTDNEGGSDQEEEKVHSVYVIFIYLYT